MLKGSRAYTEEEIVNGCVRNERKFQEILYRRHFDKMMGMCMRYAKDEDKAMQILNDGFLKVFHHIGSFSFKGSLEGWIRRIVFRSLSDFYRKESKYLRFIVLDEPEKQYDETALDKLYYEDILDCVERLPERSREVFTLYAIDGFTHQEIGERLGISDGTSKWHLSHARMKLKELLRIRFREQYAG